MHPWAPTNSCVHICVYVVRASFEDEGRWTSLRFNILHVVFECMCVCVIFHPPTLPSPFSWGDYGYDGYGYDDGYGGSLRTGWNVIEQLFLHFSLFFGSSVFLRNNDGEVYVCNMFIFAICRCSACFRYLSDSSCCRCSYWLFCLTFFHLLLQLNRL